MFRYIGRTEVERTRDVHPASKQRTRLSWSNGKHHFGVSFESDVVPTSLTKWGMLPLIEYIKVFFDYVM